MLFPTRRWCAMFVPNSMLKQLYTLGSLQQTQNGFQFSLKNRLKDAHFYQIKQLFVDNFIIDKSHILLAIDEKTEVDLYTLEKSEGFEFPLGKTLNVCVKGILDPNIDSHHIDLMISTKPFGDLHLVLKDAVSKADNLNNKIPRSRQHDLHADIIAERQKFITQKTGVLGRNLFQYDVSLDSLKGNIEQFTGIAQIPVGVAGPLKVCGEHASDEYYIPLATTEGTLVASYSRGMKVLNLSGGVSVSVVDDAMQRAPVFVFNEARKTREFSQWVDENMNLIRQHAEVTDPFVKLRNIDCYSANKFAFLRFNYTTGDAAGQNMVGRATYAACGWILEHYPDIENFFLESNMATDKKSSQINILNTRGKRVTAEVTIKKQDLINVMRVDPKQIDTHRRVASVGSFLAGTHNSGLHSANGIAAMFIATGQDVANVAESSTGILFTELTGKGDLYLSLTLPSLIVATCGGGTALGTQRECLELMQCFGPGNVYKFAEIVAAVALAGEISLASAISSLDWVTSHEEMGRN